MALKTYEDLDKFFAAAEELIGPPTETSAPPTAETTPKHTAEPYSLAKDLGHTVFGGNINQVLEAHKLSA